jgi:hypothetical protein
VDEQTYKSTRRVRAPLSRSARASPRDVPDRPTFLLLAFGGVAALATTAALIQADRSTSVVFGFLAVACAAIASALVLFELRIRRGRSPSTLSASWEERLSGWHIFLAGCLLALPIVSFYSRVLPPDNDSARLLASILHVHREGIDHLVESQEVLLPHLALGPFVALGGIPALQAINVLSVIALGGVVAFLSWRLTGSTVGVVAGVLALTALPQILQRSVLVPMYPAMLAFGFLGVYFAYQAMTPAAAARRWRAAALAAVCLLLSMEAHELGQLFVVLSALLLVSIPSRQAAVGLGRVYACLALVSIPRALINLADGGVDHFFSNRADYWVSNGYLKTIQLEVLNYPRGLSLGEYLGRLPEELLHAWGVTGWLTLGLSAVSILVASSRLRRFIVACALVLLLAIVYYRVPFFPRYFSPLLVGSALGAGVTAAALARRPSLPWRFATAATLVALLVANVANYHDRLDRFQNAETPYRDLTAEIGPGEGVIGTRSFHLNDTSTDPSTYGTQFLTESEYRLFLTWPSDADVIALMRRHGVSWVYVPERAGHWVVRYNNAWLGPAYGEAARYHREVARSPSFCLAKRVNGAALYRLDVGERRRPTDPPPPRCS